MEENVALDSSKQKQFVKSIKVIKKILKGQDKAEPKKENANNVKTGKVKKAARKKKGLVYLSHIPHGFYEHEMTEYFKQFGVVTNARVIRSKRTGMSKGYAFVEFRDPNVAEIVAETMNNYLMGKRLIKAAVIPPEKQRKNAKRKHWNAQNNPGYNERLKAKKEFNSIKDEQEELKIAKKLISNLNKTKTRLRELDIDYDFFRPVDIPEPLLNLVEVKKEDIKTTGDIKSESDLNDKVKKEETVQNKSKKNNGKKAIEVKPEEPTLTKQADSSAQKKSKKLKVTQKPNNNSNLVKDSVKDNIKNKKTSNAETNVAKESKKKDTKNIENSKASKTQKQKEQKLKDAGVKPPENFIQISKESDDESEGSSVNFDSDEFDKAMEEGDSDVESNDESDETDEELDEDITSEEDNESVEPETPPSKKVAKPSKMKKQTKQNVLQGKQQITSKTAPQLVKKMPQSAKPSRKPKFEKKGKKTLNKVIKKKK